MSLVGNEQTKLLANSLDRVSTACATVGVAGPVAGALYGTRIEFGMLVALCYIWLFAAGNLHLAARWVLRSLEE